MNPIQNEWKKMRIKYQIRYAKMFKKAKDEFNTDNHGALLEMSYVLITIFRLTPKQVEEVERNGGLTNKDMEENKWKIYLEEKFVLTEKMVELQTYWDVDMK